MGQDSGTSPSYHVPRLLAFYQDLWDDDGTAMGWRPIAWGLRFADGSAISVNIEGRPSVTLWHSIEDATEALDAYVDTPEPRAHLDAPLPPPPPPRPVDPTGPAGDSATRPGEAASDAGVGAGTPAAPADDEAFPSTR
jgi:hypothetical protein